MKIIYHCYGGAHSSVTAAAIHLGLLPVDHVPEKQEFWQLPLFDRQDADEHGHIYFMGIDEFGHEIYLTARRSRPLVLEKVFAGLAGIFDIPQDDYLFVNVMEKVNLTMKFGGFISRRWGFIRFGRPIVTMGTQAAYFRVVELVRKIKDQVGKDSEKDSVLQRQQTASGRAGRSHTYRTPARGESTGQKPAVGPAVFEYKRRGG
ncbi:DUF3189 family protein [Pelotomaculum propionicicum]|uniref:DUF3189 domain-containing protein n=1 Tax=Pelotomaculum propionicicum TaxID=258475 RepID=A0A4Y7RS26_9FIRM|nr:DUF3189 family protein [Pelotomaculum propionicicum]TEB11798.1 hypothetical protein Pmgp_01376 [Pelotomaculum propionicicum]